MVGLSWSGTERKGEAFPISAYSAEDAAAQVLIEARLSSPLVNDPTVQWVRPEAVARWVDVDDALAAERIIYAGLSLTDGWFDRLRDGIANAIADARKAR